jgi:transglutaminase-like putative cysteine protease
LLGLSWNATAEQLPPTAGAPPTFSSVLNQPTRPTPALAPLDQLAATYRTPHAVAAFLRKEFQFQRDEELFGEIDRWQSPEAFLQRRVGDCEDYALLAKELLQRNGIEAYVFSLFGEEGYAHTVSVFVDEDGRYNVINQDKLRRYRAKTLEAVAAQINPAWTVAMIAEQDGPRGRVVREIINPHPISWDDDPPAFEF